MLVLNPSPSDGERVNATVGFPVAPTQTWLPAEGTQRVAARHEPAFDKLRGFFRDLSSIRFSAEVTLWRPDRNAEGTFLYETDGKRYYLKSTIDPRAGLAPSLEAAYDLDHYQIFYPEDSRLHLYRTPPSHLAAPFPNPLFLPLGFLGWKDDDCSTCELDLAAVLDQARWVARVGAARGVEGAVSDTVWLPGGVFGGEPYAFQILVNRKSEQLERIELVRPQGKKISTLELLDWERPLQSREAFPYHIVLRGYDETGNVGAVLHVHFQGLEINRPAASERFTIDESGARIVIDEDARTFLKHPQMRPPE